MADTTGMPDIFTMLKVTAYLQTHPGQQTLGNVCSSEANLTCALSDCQIGLTVQKHILGLKRCIADILMGQANRAQFHSELLLPGKYGGVCDQARGC